MHVERVRVKYRVSFDLLIISYQKRLITATLFLVDNPKLKLRRLPPQLADTLVDLG